MGTAMSVADTVGYPRQVLTCASNKNTNCCFQTPCLWNRADGTVGVAPQPWIPSDASGAKAPLMSDWTAWDPARWPPTYPQGTQEMHI